MLKVPAKDLSWQFLEHDLPVDTLPILEEVLSFTNEWLLDTSRQDRMTTHKDTQMFQLKFMSYLWSLGQGNTSENINDFKTDNAKNAINQVFSFLENLYDGKVVRCEIIKMNERGQIPPHVDSGQFLSLGRRVHVPLITNPNVFFTVFNNTINMQVGKCYEINNSLPHSVDNKSDEIRIHIICDILENKYLSV